MVVQVAVPLLPATVEQELHLQSQVRPYSTVAVAVVPADQVALAAVVLVVVVLDPLAQTA
jgi:hypothetical protein